MNCFNQLGEIIDKWKKSLREIFFKDSSLYTMPVGACVPEDPEIVIEEVKDLSDESNSDEEDISDYDN